MIEPLIEVAGHRFFQGDCLEVLAQLPDGSVDALMTDPPYSSGGQFRGDRTGGSTGAKYLHHGGPQTGAPDFAGDTRDQRGWAYWSALWLSQCLRIAKPGAPLFVFSDWRQLPTATDMIQAGGWVWRGIAVWDKTEGVRPQKGRPRAQAEFLVWGSKGGMAKPTPESPCPAGVWRENLPGRSKVHQTQKPVAMLREMLRVLPTGSTILDPFLGSGSTAVAAHELGHRCVGVEFVPYYLEVAAQRIRETVAQPGLFALAAEPEQITITGEAGA